MKKPIWKRWWFWTIIVVVVLCIVAGSSDSSDEGAKKVEESKIEQTDTNKTDTAKKDTKDKKKDGKGKEEKEEFYVGDKVKLVDYAIKVTKVSHSNGTQYDKPKSGKERALYDVSGQLFLRFILDSHHLYVCRQRAAYTAAYVTAAALLLSAALHHYAQPQPADHGSTGACFLGPLFHRPCKPSVKSFLLIPHIL